MTLWAPKPLGRKSYGSIPHLPGSRLGPGEHCIPEGQARLLTVETRDRWDRVIVQQKLDGSCCAVAKIGGEIVALSRAGYRAETSPYTMHHVFAQWVQDNRDAFDAVLESGQRIVGEWLYQAHGTRYHLPHAPFVAFDVMVEDMRFPYSQFIEIAEKIGLPVPQVVAMGPTPIDVAMERLDPNAHGALDPIEGLIYRLERTASNGVTRVQFLAKYVRPDKTDGIYLPGANGNPDDMEPIINRYDAWRIGESL